MNQNKEYRLIVRGPDWYANISVTRIEKVNSCVYAWYKDEFVGMFDLDAVDMLYRTNEVN